MDVETTEITELEATKVSGVASPANGTPHLVLKATDSDTEDCETCKGSGKILAGNRTCPKCKGDGTLAKSDSAESDEIEEEITGSAAKDVLWCGDLGCTVCSAAKAELSAADRKALPTSSFAYVDSKGGRHLPMHDAAHIKAALGRFSSQDFSDAKDPKAAKKTAAKKILSAAKAKSVEVDAKSDVAKAAKKSTGVPDAATKTPTENGHLDTGKSGVVGSVTAGTKDPSATDDNTFTLGGQTTSEIPDEAKAQTNAPANGNTDAAGIVNPQALAKAVTVASLAEAIDQLTVQRAAIKDGKYLEADGAAAADVSSMPWEDYDSATLAQVATCLASCCKAIDGIAQRERTEAVLGDSGDYKDAWDLEEAETALEYALGVAARLSFHEAAEGSASKSGRVLSGKTETALVAARDHLSAVIDGAKQAASPASSDEEVITVADVTKDELAEMIATGSAAAVKAALKEERKAAKKAAKLEAEEKAEAEKNANNDGDVSTADVKATAEADAEDVNSVGGSVDAEYVNKSADEAFTKMTDQLEGLSKELATVKESVQKFAKQPRSGGPSLDGQARGVVPAAEGRLGDVTKGAEDAEIEKLQKELDEATDPTTKDQLGLKLTRVKLTRLHESGQL